MQREGKKTEKGKVIKEKNVKNKVKNRKDWRMNKEKYMEKV